jgi:hypothetical protein
MIVKNIDDYMKSVGKFVRNRIFYF